MFLCLCVCCVCVCVLTGGMMKQCLLELNGEHCIREELEAQENSERVNTATSLDGRIKERVIRKGISV